MSAVISIRRGVEQGLALIAVLWIVASLSLLAVGLSATTRSELRGAQSVQSAAVATAAGDAAIQMAILEMLSTGTQLDSLVYKTYLFQGREIRVEAAPANGMININLASDVLLQDLFVFGAGMEEAAAEALAQRVIDWRSPESALEAEDYEAAGVAFRPRGEPFAYPEDLLQVLGVSFDVYDKVRGLITTHGDAPGVHPLAATVDVLKVLARGDADLAARIAAGRDEQDPAIDLTGLTQQHFSGGFTRVYRIAAHVPIGERRIVREHWVDLGQSSEHNGMQWKTLGVSAARSFEGLSN